MFLLFLEIGEGIGYGFSALLFFSFFFEFVVEFFCVEDVENAFEYLLSYLIGGCEFGVFTVEGGTFVVGCFQYFVFVV